MSAYHSVSEAIRAPGGAGFTRTARKRIFVRFGADSQYLYEQPDLGGNELAERAMDVLVDAMNREDWETADDVFGMLRKGNNSGRTWEEEAPSGDLMANKILERLWELRQKFESTTNIHEVVVRDVSDLEKEWDVCER